MKLEVGQFVRTDKVGIKKIYKIDNNKTKYKYLYKLKNQDDDGCIDLGVLCENNIIKASYSIIDILEKGDYVNGSKVVNINYDLNYDEDIVESITIFDYSIEGNDILYNEDIKSIVTKKQFEDMEYRIGELV